MNFLHVWLHFLFCTSEKCSAVNIAADNQKEEQNNHGRFSQESKQKFAQIATKISQVNINLKYLCTYSFSPLWTHYWCFHECIAYQRIKSLLRAICRVSWMLVIKIFAVPVLI